MRHAGKNDWRGFVFLDESQSRDVEIHEELYNAKFYYIHFILTEV